MLLLAERGALSLTDPISRWVAGVPNGDTITLAHLLNHTSGLDDYLFTPAIQARQDQMHTPAELLAAANALSPRAPPGSPHEYSNTNFVLIGLASEAAGGAPWATLVRDLLLDPLALADTFVFGYEPVPGGFVHGYVGTAGAWVDGSADLHPTVVYAAGCMVSTAPDLARWFEALFLGGVLNAASLRAMTDDHRVATIYPNEYVGLGLFVGDDLMGLRLYKHGGGLTGYTTNVERADPVGTVLAVNFNTSTDPSASLRSLRLALWPLLPTM